VTTASYRIGGRRLVATAVFDTYWRFAAARQAVYEARLAGAPAPWSDDPVLQTFRFTNVYRAADRVSQFLISNVIYDGEHDADDLVFRTLLFKLFNRIETWQRLEQAVGRLSWRTFDPKHCGAALDELAAAGPIYSPAYVIPPPRLGAPRKHRNHLRLLQVMMEDDLSGRVRKAGGLREIYDALATYPSIGRFLAFQFTIDLNYTPLTSFNEDDYIVAGPGAIDGIRKCFGPEAAGREESVIRFMVDAQDEQFARLGLPFGGLFGRRLHLIDAQNLFCEVDKYARVVHPEAQGRSGRNRIKQRFRPRAAQLTALFPPKWGLAVERQGRGVEVDAHDTLSVPP
jgi:alpha-glutamyl/putrescinyl thymine pyrophosphorylase clade 1